jgi:hypothetical protein
MTSSPEVIDLTSSPVSSSSSPSRDGWSNYFPPSVLPLRPHLTKEQAKKKIHDVGSFRMIPSPTSIDSSHNTNPWIWNRTSQGDLVSPFLFTSDDESSEDEDKDPSFIPPSTPERHQSRHRRSNPQLQNKREVVLGLPSSLSGVSYPGCRGKGKGKAKLA